MVGALADAFAASPHYVRSPTATVEGNSLVVSWKEAVLEHDVVRGFNLASVLLSG